MAARQRISEKLLADLAVVWETHGSIVLDRLAETDPGKLAQCLRLVAQRRLHQRRAADARQPGSRQVGDPTMGDRFDSGNELGPVLEMIESALTILVSIGLTYDF